MLNDDPSGGRRYQDEVPAVARAVRLLECLARSGDARALADLARELDIRPSSLLAILTTLRHAGLVARTASGQYEVGPGLAALGSAAACKLRACERFAAIADDLVAAFGETVLLWLRHEDTFVLAAAREGTQPLRYVPTPGLRVSAGDTRLAALTTADLDPGPAPVTGPGVTTPHGADHGICIEEGLMPGVWTVAARLSAGLAEQACVAVAGPRERVVAPEVRAALLAATAQSAVAGTGLPLAHGEMGERGASPGGQGWGRSPATAASGPIHASELDAFLRQSLVATLSYLADDGYPATVPLWYAWDGAAFWLASRPGSEWVEHVRLDPRVSLAVSESTPPLRRVLARGRLVEIDDPGSSRWDEIEAQLAERYAGFDAAREPATAGRGRLLQLTPERLIAWRGLLRHPKLPPEPEHRGTGTTSWRHLG